MENKVIKIERIGDEIILYNGKMEKIKVNLNDNKGINAKDIFDALDYTIGQKYSLEPLADNSDDQLSVFYNLINDICTQINNIDIDEDQLIKDVTIEKKEE